MDIDNAPGDHAEPHGKLELIRFSNEIDDVAVRLTQVFDQLMDVRVRGECRDAQNVVEKVTLKSANLRRCISGGFGYSAVAHDSIMLGFSTKGGVRMTAGGSEVLTKPYEVGEAMPAGRPIALDKAPASMLYLLDVPQADIVAQAETLLGHRQYRGIEELQVELRSAPGAAYVRNTLHIFQELASLQSLGLGLTGLVAFEEHLLNLVIGATRPDLFGQGNSDKDFAPATVQRAMDYLESHAAQPIRIADVASLLGVSTRVLQLSFKRHVGCSPLEFLLKCRLELAHSRLLSATAYESVASIATECGFVSLGNFACRYRTVYGHLPSHTLRRALMRR